MGGPPSPVLLRIQQLRRNFVQEPSVSRKTGLSERVLSAVDWASWFPRLLLTLVDDIVLGFFTGRSAGLECFAWDASRDCADPFETRDGLSAVSRIKTARSDMMVAQTLSR